MPVGDLALACCDECSLVFNRLFDPALGEIGARYESSQGASGTFGAFADALARRWIEQHALVGKTVLEVGCGSGDFLRRLVSNGVARAIGIDPFADEGKNSPHLSMTAAPFDDRSVGIEADALVCRHTLEHVQDVRGFLGRVRQWAGADPRRVVLFELPAGERVFAERAFWDVYYEHCNYFTEATLRDAVELAGFEVLALERVYGEQYLTLEARAARTPHRSASPTRAAVAVAQAAYRAYGDAVRASTAHCQAELERLQSSAAPLMLWQAASKTVGFLSMLADPSVVDSAVDLSAERHGKFLPGSGLAVHSPAELLRLRPGNIVLMNPIYLAEVTSQVREMGLSTTVHSVNSLLGARLA